MSKDTPVSHDAREFGVHVRSGGWRLGLLVARSVHPGTGNGGDRRSDQRNDRNADPATKVSAREFARQSGTSAPRVLRFLEAWDRAAAAGHVPPAHDLNPGVEIDLPDGDETPWADFYDAGKSSTDDSVRRSIKAVERNIDSDPEFAARVAAKLAESQPATIAKLAANPDVARAIARNDVTREAVEEEAIQHRARHRRDDLPDPKDVGRRAADAMSRRMEIDMATSALRAAIGNIAEAIVNRDQFGIRYPDAEAEALDRLKYTLATYEAERGLTDEDRAVLAEMGIQA